MSGVTAILCIYKRAHNFEEQIQALMNQTYPIDKYIIRVNQSDEDNQNIVVPHEIMDKIQIIHSYSNLWVRARFYAWLNTNTSYVYIIDDDVIPGKNWVEMCVRLAEQEEGIYGARGSVFNSMTVRKDREIVDETYKFNDEKKLVDMSWRAWFMNRFILNYIAYEIPPHFPLCWEELWISYMAKKHWGINTYIPRMDIWNPDTWGNMKPSLGVDRVANHNREKNNYQLFYEQAIEHWFIPLKHKLWKSDS